MEIDWLDLYNEFRIYTEREPLDLTNRNIDFQELQAFNEYLKKERKKLQNSISHSGESQDRMQKIEKYIW